MTEKFVLITGCSQGGLGFALAEAFQQSGFHVFATVRSPEKAGRLLDQANVEVLELDVKSADLIAACVQRIAARTGGRLDILVNNSGTAMFGPLAHAPLDEAKNLYDVNVWGTLAVAQAFLPMLIQSHGVMLNIASIAGAVPLAWQGAGS